MPGKLINIIFTLSLFGAYAAFVTIPRMMADGSISDGFGWNAQAILVGFCIGNVGFALGKFFDDISGIRFALQRK